MKEDTHENFSAKLIALYPELFPKDEDGNSVAPRSGIYAPEGWHVLIETLCNSIDMHVKNPISVQKWKALFSMQMFLFKKLFVPVYNKVYRWVNPTESLHWKNGKRETWITISPAEEKRLQEKHPVRTLLRAKLQIVSNMLRPNYRWREVKCQPVKIGQIKEKFGTLRFYYSGGDAYIESIVSFAEAMSARTCERTGRPGYLQKRGGWYKVLSKEEGDSLGYTAA